MPSLPPNGAMHGAQIDGLMVVIHLLMAVVFMGWLVYFVLALVRGSRPVVSAGPAPKAGGGPPKKGPSGRGRVGMLSEVAIASVEIAILVGLALPLWSQRSEEAPPEGMSTVVRVVAEQYAWNLHYPGPDGQFGQTDLALVSTENPLGLDRTDPAAKDDIVSLNVMHVPVGRPVLVYLSSKDVIHSFGLPLFRVKQDAIPGQRAKVWFTPERTSAELRLMMAASYRVDPADSVRDLSGLSPLEEIRNGADSVIVAAGTPLTPDVIGVLGQAGIRKVLAAPDTPTEITCAQLCGLGHYRMRGFLTVESDSAYQAWLSDQAALLAAR